MDNFLLLVQWFVDRPGLSGVRVLFSDSCKTVAGGGRPHANATDAYVAYSTLRRSGDSGSSIILRANCKKSQFYHTCLIWLAELSGQGVLRRFSSENNNWKCQFHNFQCQWLLKERVFAHHWDAVLKSPRERESPASFLAKILWPADIRQSVFSIRK